MRGFRFGELGGVEVALSASFIMHEVEQNGREYAGRWNEWANQDKSENGKSGILSVIQITLAIPSKCARVLIP